MDTIFKISVAHDQSPILCSEDWCKPQQQHPYPLRWLGFMISPNLLSLGSIFCQHRTLDILRGQLQYALTPQSNFLKLNKLIREKPSCSLYLFITYYSQLPIMSAIDRFHCNSVLCSCSNFEDYKFYPHWMITRFRDPISPRGPIILQLKLRGRVVINMGWVRPSYRRSPKLVKPSD